MKYLWTEDTGAGLHFWKLVNQLFFDDAFVIESKGSTQGLLDVLSDLDIKEGKRSKTRRSDTVPILRYDIRSLFI